ncbi:MAG: MgtC/SapB family protein [Allisonella histaminiformans]|uniref:MgtC/SapB family protein n=1 Tax=Allisonella histaminiformans TaxID=209880 RepID=UPI0025890698|nr:MgtC/SapB family protein [Allisonella histaminiformans]MDY4540384.1 MgtC/SapB family protein [Allisonella histaminiformans]
MTAIITFFHLWSIPSVIARLIIATLAGTIIGLDREAKNKEAGVKTHALVCMGAALAIIVNEFAFYQFPGSNIDITRMGAQVISGIGFLGVGTIIVTMRSRVVGLTTAAGLWASAGVGLAIGFGFIECVIPAFILILFVYRVLGPLDKKFRRNSRSLNLYIEFKTNEDVRYFLRFLKEMHVKLYDFDFSKDQSGQQLIVAVVSMRLPRRSQKIKFKSQLRDNPHILYFEEV